MLRFLYGDQLAAFPKLADTMFCDRADQFKTRLGWDVAVDAAGHERDSYDALNPLYVIWENSDGSHGGSMRFLPTVGQTMVNDHFAHLLTGGAIQSPLIWECTRFCLARGASSKVAAALMLGGGEIMQRLGVEHFVGVFDARMVRIYRMIGASPEVLGSAGIGRDKISVGLWHFDAAHHAHVAHSAGLRAHDVGQWFERSLTMGRATDLSLEPAQRAG